MSSNFSILLKILRTIIQTPHSLAKVLEDDSVFRSRVVEHGWANGLPTIDLLDICPNFHEVVEPFSFLEGTSLPIDLALLRALARKYNDCRYFEIGTWRGESVSNVADIASECVSLSLSDLEMGQMGFSQSFIDTHRFFSDNVPNIRHLYANSRNFDFAPFANQFDLIFIDGDHTYEGVKSDTANAFKLIKDEHSMIVWHDYGTSTEQVRWSVLAGILDACPKEKQNNLYHISNTMCAIYTIGDYSSSYPKFPITPDKFFSLDIRVKKL